MNAIRAFIRTLVHIIISIILLCIGIMILSRMEASGADINPPADVVYVGLPADTQPYPIPSPCSSNVTGVLGPKAPWMYFTDGHWNSVQCVPTD